MIDLTQVDCIKQCDDSQVFTGKNILNLENACGCATCDCGNYIPVSTLGDWRALATANFNYLVWGTIFDQGQIPSLVMIAITNELDEATDETLLTDIIGSGQTFYYLGCSTNLSIAEEETITNSGCNCSFPIIVETVGELLAAISTEGFSYILINTGSENLITLGLDSGQIEELQALDPNKLINDALPGTIFNDAIFFRSFHCSTNLLAGVEVPLTNSFEGAIQCVDDEQVQNFHLTYYDIPVGTTVQIYSLVSGGEFFITASQMISGSGTLDVWAKTMDADAGNNYLMVQFGGAGIDIENIQIDIIVPECGEEKRTIVIDSAEVVCQGDVGMTLLSIEFTTAFLHPSGDLLNFYALVGGVETLIQQTNGYSNGTYFISFLQIFDANSYIRAEIDGTTVVSNKVPFTTTCETDSPNVILLEERTIQSCEGEGQNLLDIYLQWVNLPTGTDINIYAIFNGNDDVLLHTATVGSGGNSAPEYHIGLSGIDQGTNHIRIEVVALSIDDTYPLDVIVCAPSITIVDIESPNHCNGGLQEFQMWISYANIPSLSTIDHYMLVGAVETLISGGGGISGTQSNESHSTITGLSVDVGVNYMRIVINLNGGGTVEDTIPITVIACP